ncbi:putative Qa-SNARE protein [Leishmania major strain Friedlin]|uniref:Putative Qa-SNARE protein n=1 Tax=Leishmania major TaxID=5664 RepID=Q4QEF6_LEIMA|nr:putative Qa-SNARE protein [Leishmania major strain Friedlin]CAG9572263.1 Qa-SNARE_protein_-_putative [Leishmania major strain Friedlin]CAJ03503.1 putative Qa-SNARE protein [Leishmania major strain Friedlin]|eukprot:XP_001682292.1 putative Qa-SNARE protein [Leishmania major strain Friedlin]
MADAVLYHKELLDLEQQVEALPLDVRAPHQPATAGVGSSSSSGTGRGGGGNVNSSSARAATFAKAQDILRRLNRLLQQLRVEMRLLEGEERGVYETHASAHAKKIASLREWVQQSKERAAQSTAASMAVATAASSSQGQRSTGVHWPPREGDNDEAEGGDGPVMSNCAEARQAATRINEVQHSTLQSLGRSEKLLNETETLGHEAATTLRAQTEQIKQTTVELDEMRSELGRASTELKCFMRRMALDRLIICFVIVILVCIIITVVLAVLKHKRR